jgi:hypothetical protein
MAWREAARRNPNGDQFRAVGRLALGHPPSRPWTGYCQRHRRKTVRQPGGLAISQKTSRPAHLAASTSPRLA